MPYLQSEAPGPIMGQIRSGPIEKRSGGPLDIRILNLRIRRQRVLFRMRLRIGHVSHWFLRPRCARILG